MAGSIRKLKEEWNYEIEIDEIYVQDALNNIDMLHKKDDGFIAVAEKKKEDVSNKDADDKQQHKNADDIVKSIDTALTSKLGKDYKSSLLTGIYSKEEL